MKVFWKEVKSKTGLHSLIILATIALSFLLFYSPQKALAAYDPGLVISDSQLMAKNTMSEADIQAFLVSKNSTLANMTVPAARTVTYYIDNTRTITTYENTVIGPYGVSSEVNVAGWRISKLIYQAAQWYNVNPQVILTIIQKESIYITRTDGVAMSTPGHDSYATYAWLMGYAYTEDTANPAKNACGVATPGANPTKSCAGIAAQIDNSTWALANWANLANTHSTGNAFTCPAWSDYYWTNDAFRLCDDEWVTARSGATAALYRYTPHTGLTGGYTGNRGFYSIYLNWFDFNKYISEDTLRVTSYITTATTSPSIGESQTVTLKVRNFSSDPITVDFGIADEAIDAKKWESFPVKSEIIFSPGEEKELIYTKTNQFAGNHKIWPSFKNNGTWFDCLAQDGYIVKKTSWVHLADIRGMVYSFSSMPPAVGQPFQTTVSIKNFEKSPITLDNLGVANYNETLNIWRSLDTNVANILIGPGETKTFNYTKTLDLAGTYNSWPTYSIGAAWFSLKNMDFNVLSYRYNTKFENQLKLTSNIGFSAQGSPSIGETLTANVKIKNFSTYKISVDFGLADEVPSAKKWESFPLKAGLEFLPGEEKDLVFVKKTQFAGNHVIWPSFKFNNVWYDAYPVGNQTRLYGLWVHLADIRGMVYSFSSMPPAVGQPFQTTVSIKNFEKSPITLDNLGVANYNETLNIWRSLDTNVANILIGPGETKTFNYTKTLDLAGTYNSWPTYSIGAAWFSLKNMDFNLVGYRYFSR